MHNFQSAGCWFLISIGLCTATARGVTISTTIISPPGDGYDYTFQGLFQGDVLMQRSLPHQQWTLLHLTEQGPVNVLAGFSGWSRYRLCQYDGQAENLLVQTHGSGSDPDQILAYNGSTTTQVWTGQTDGSDSISRNAYPWNVWPQGTALYEYALDQSNQFDEKLTYYDFATGNKRVVYTEQPDEFAFSGGLMDQGRFHFFVKNNTTEQITTWRYDGQVATPLTGPNPLADDESSMAYFSGGEEFVVVQSSTGDTLYHVNGSHYQQLTSTAAGDSVYVPVARNGGPILVPTYTEDQGITRIAQYDNGQLTTLLAADMPGVLYNAHVNNQQTQMPVIDEHRPDGPGRIYRIVNGQAVLVHQLPADSTGLNLLDVTDNRIVFQEFVEGTQQRSRLIRLDETGRTDLTPYATDDLPPWIDIVGTPGDALIVFAGDQLHMIMSEQPEHFDLFLIEDDQAIQLDAGLDPLTQAPQLLDWHDEAGRPVLAWAQLDYRKYYEDEEEADYMLSDLFTLYLDGEQFTFHGQFGALEPGRMFYTDAGQVFEVT